MKLFHLSEENHDGEIFKPRVPHSLMTDEYCKVIEDNKTKRVCFSRTMTGAYYSICFNGGYQTLYVHVPDNIEELVSRKKIKIPTSKQVYDADYCDEVWVRGPVRMKCIGKVCIGYRLSWFSNRPKVHYKWLKRFNC